MATYNMHTHKHLPLQHLMFEQSKPQKTQKTQKTHEEQKTHKTNNKCVAKKKVVKKKVHVTHRQLKAILTEINRKESMERRANAVPVKPYDIFGDTTLQKQNFSLSESHFPNRWSSNTICWGTASTGGLAAAYFGK